MSLSAVFFHSSSFLFNFTSFEEKKYFRLFPICVYAVIIVYKYMSVFVFVIGCVWVECVSVCAFEIFSFYGFQNSQFFFKFKLFAYVSKWCVCLCVCVMISLKSHDRHRRGVIVNQMPNWICAFTAFSISLHYFYTYFILDLCCVDEIVRCVAALHSPNFFSSCFYSL